MSRRVRLMARLAGAATVALAWPLAAQAGSAQAAAMGCYNCHGAQPRGDAPRFEQLMQRLAQRRGDAAAEQHLLDELREAGEAQGIRAHRQLREETARELVRWLFEGDAAP